MAALTLYHWNAQVAASFLFPLHIFEICVRNAVANAAETAYNPRWPWAPAFHLSLPDPPYPNFSPRREIRRSSTQHNTTGTVIADTKFAFWVSMFTSRHHGRLWQPHLAREFPHIAAGTPAHAVRKRIYEVADQVRGLRNRIAHHEPIFARDLVTDYTAMLEIVGLRCVATAAWMNRSQTVFNLLTLKP
jgi:hypothetical protein